MGPFQLFFLSHFPSRSRPHSANLCPLGHHLPGAHLIKQVPEPVRREQAEVGNLPMGSCQEGRPPHSRCPRYQPRHASSTPGETATTLRGFIPLPLPLAASGSSTAGTKGLQVGPKSRLPFLAAPLLLPQRVWLRVVPATASQLLLQEPGRESWSRAGLF